MKTKIEGNNGQAAQVVVTFTAYALQVILKQRIKGFDVIGLTTDRLNGLHIGARSDYHIAKQAA